MLAVSLWLACSVSMSERELLPGELSGVPDISPVHHKILALCVSNLCYTIYLLKILKLCNVMVVGVLYYFYIFQSQFIIAPIHADGV